MKIVNIVLSSKNGGAVQVFIDYIAVLKNIGHEVLAMMTHDAPYADRIENHVSDIKLTK